MQGPTRVHTSIVTSGIFVGQGCGKSGLDGRMLTKAANGRAGSRDGRRTHYFCH